MTDTREPVRLLSSCGRDLAPDAARWFADPDEDDLFALDGLDHPVLDVGCGPGRIVGHLAGSGVTALGVDVSREAVRRSAARGAPVLHRSVFDPLPGIGRWGAAVLLDGNIGIGGDPTRLLRRLGALVRRGGRIVAEVERPGTESLDVEARICLDGVVTDWFPWSLVSADAVDGIADAAGLRLLSIRSSRDRWFAMLQRD